MAEPTIAPYGSWKSPITTDLVVAKFTGMGDLHPVGDALYWLESRPLEGGRQVIMRQSADGAVAELTPPPFNVRTRVHEYGGGAWLAGPEGAGGSGGDSLYFVNFADQRLYVQSPPTAAPRALTPEGPMRYADLALDDARGRLLCVREDHTGDGQPVNTLAAVDLARRESSRQDPRQVHSGPWRSGPSAGTFGWQSQVLVSGSDFYSDPRLSPDGRQSGLAQLEPSQHALGRHRAVAGRARRRTACRPTPAAWPAATTRASSSPNGRRWASCTSSPTAAAGGTCTGCAAARRRPSGRARPILPRRSGSSG